MQVRVEAELAVELGMFDVVSGVQVAFVDEVPSPLDASAFRELVGAAITDEHGRAEIDKPRRYAVLRIERVAAPAHPGGAIAIRPRYVAVEAADVAASGRVLVPAAAWRALRRDADAWTVVGRIRGREGRPVPELVVDVLDADILQHDALGRAVTDADGRFRVDFRESAFRDAPIGPGELLEGPDLFFHVRTPGGVELLREKAVRGHLPDRANRSAVAVVELRVDIDAPDRKAIAAGPRGVQRRHELIMRRWATDEDSAAWTTRGYAQRDSMRAPRPEDDDPGPGAERGLRAVGQGVVRAAEPPTQTLSRGQAGAFVEVEARGPVTVSIPLDPAAASHLDPTSLRLFRWDATKSWTLVERSGLGGDGTYVFGRVARSGRYAVFGLPRDQARRVLLNMLWEATALFPLLDAAKVDRTELPRAVSRALLSDKVIASRLLEDPQRLAAIGLPDAAGDLAAILGRPLGDLPRDEKGKPIGEPEGYPAPLFLLGGDGFAIGGFMGGGDLGGFGGLDKLPGGRRGSPVGWEPGDDICPPFWWRFPEFQLIPGRGGRWGIPGGGGGVIVVPCGCTEWESLGPANVPGRMKGIAWHPTNANIAYCAATGGGIWRSTNAGQDWTPVMLGELSLSMGAIAVAPSSPDTLYAGTGEYHSWGSWNGSTLSGVGVYRSTDAGNDWDLMPTTGGVSTRISAIVVDANNADLVYVAGNMGVHRYDATTRAWTRILATECSSLVADPSTPARLYAAIEGADGVVVTNNARAATVVWGAFNTGITFPTTVPRFGKLAISPANTGILYLSLNNEPPAGPGNAWFRTTSRVYRWNGTTWVDRGTHGGTTYGGWTNVIAVDPSNAERVLVGATGLEESTDGGATWTGRDGGHADQQCLAFCPTNGRISLLANDGGIWRRDTSTAATDYAISSRGLATTELYNVSVSRSGAFRIGGSTQDNGVIKSDGSSTFVGMGGNEGGLFEVDPNDSRIIYWDPWSGNLTRTTNGQGSGGAQVITGITANADGSIPSINALAVKRGDSQIVVMQTDTNVLYRSTNGAASWTQVATAGAGGINRFAWAPSRANRCYFVTNNGQVWRSDNDGAAFASVAGATLPAGRNVCGLAIDRTDADTVYVTLAGIGIGIGHVWRSTDAGVTWADISGAQPHSRVPDLGFYAIAQRRDFPETLYAACDLGVFVTRDGGDWWYPYDEGLPNALVSDMDYADTTDTLYLATSSRGFWRRRVN